MGQPRLQLRPWPLIKVACTEAVHKGDGLVQPAGCLQITCGEPQPGRDVAGRLRWQPRREDGQRRGKLRLVERLDDAGGVVPGCAFAGRVVRRRHLGQHLAGQSGLRQQFEPPPPARPRHQRPQFRSDPLGAHGGHQVRHASDRRLRLLFERKAKPRRKPYRAEHPQVILAKPHRRVADRPHDPRGEIGPAADIVVHLA